MTLFTSVTPLNNWINQPLGASVREILKSPLQGVSSLYLTYLRILDAVLFRKKNLFLVIFKLYLEF